MVCIQDQEEESEVEFHFAAHFDRIVTQKFRDKREMDLRFYGLNN